MRDTVRQANLLMSPALVRGDGRIGAAEHALFPVFLRGNAVLAAEGGDEMAAALETELKGDLLDGQGRVRQQLARAVQQHAIVKARGGLLRGGKKQPGKTFFAAAEEPAEVLQPEVFLAAAAHEFVGADKFATGQSL